MLAAALIFSMAPVSKTSAAEQTEGTEQAGASEQTQAPEQAGASEQTEGTEQAAPAAVAESKEIPPEHADDPEYFKHAGDSSAEQGSVMTIGVPRQRLLKSYGIDVSQYQGTIDWKKVKESGIRFAIIRVGYRGYGSGEIVADPTAIQNLEGAQAAGIGIGAYFFSTACDEAEAVEEAQYTIDMIRKYRVTYPIVYDCEGYNDTSYRNHGLTAEQRTDNAVAFLSHIRNNGYTPMMYSSLWSYNNEWNTARLESLFDIWIAEYLTHHTETETYLEDGEEKERVVIYGYPSFESISGKYTHYQRKYRIWQCSSHGAIAGINGRVDLDIEYYANAEEAVVAFVTRLYELILNRTPDYKGLKGWVDDLLTKRKTAAEVTYGVVFSKEFLNRKLNNEEFVKVLYRTCLDREADAGGLASWIDQLNGGFSRTFVLRGIVESAEFSKICQRYGVVRGSIGKFLVENRDKNAGLTSFVRRCYNVFLSREPDVYGINDWTGRVLADARQARELPFGFVFSREMMNKRLSDRDFVTTLYRGIFGREPDAPGFADWVSRLARGVSREEVLRGFVNAPEFNGLLKKYGLR